MYFIKRLYLFIWDTEYEQGGGAEREAAYRLSSQPHTGLDPGFWDHTWSQRRCLAVYLAEPPRSPKRSPLQEAYLPSTVSLQTTVFTPMLFFPIYFYSLLILGVLHIFWKIIICYMCYRYLFCILILYMDFLYFKTEVFTSHVFFLKFFSTLRS